MPFFSIPFQKPSPVLPPKSSLKSKTNVKNEREVNKQVKMKLKYIKSHCCKCTHIRKNTMRGVEVVVPFDWPKKLIPSGKSFPARVLYLENGSSKLFITGQWSSEAA